MAKSGLRINPEDYDVFMSEYVCLGSWRPNARDAFIKKWGFENWKQVHNTVFAIRKKRRFKPNPAANKPIGVKLEVLRSIDKQCLIK